MRAENKNLQNVSLTFPCSFILWLKMPASKFNIAHDKVKFDGWTLYFHDKALEKKHNH